MHSSRTVTQSTSDVSVSRAPEVIQQATVLTPQDPDIQSTISVDTTNQILYVPIGSTQQCQLIQVTDIGTLQGVTSEAVSSTLQQQPIRGQSRSQEQFPVSTTK